MHTAARGQMCMARTRRGADDHRRHRFASITAYRFAQIVWRQRPTKRVLVRWRIQTRMARGAQIGGLEGLCEWIVDCCRRLTSGQSQIKVSPGVLPSCSPRINSHSTLPEPLAIVAEDDVVGDGGKAYAPMLVQVGVSATSIRLQWHLHAADYCQAKRPGYLFFQSGRVGAVHRRPRGRRWHGISERCCSR